jgi:hypothetical protein
MSIFTGIDFVVCVMLIRRHMYLTYLAFLLKSILLHYLGEDRSLGADQSPVGTNHTSGKPLGDQSQAKTSHPGLQNGIKESLVAKVFDVTALTSQMREGHRIGKSSTLQPNLTVLQ